MKSWKESGHGIKPIEYLPQAKQAAANLDALNVKNCWSGTKIIYYIDISNKLGVINPNE